MNTKMYDQFIQITQIDTSAVKSIFMHLANVTENINSPECIRCGACKNACPVHAIKSGYRLK